MQDNLVGFSTFGKLKADAEPAVRYIVFTVVEGRNGVGKGEEAKPRRCIFGQQSGQLGVFGFEHQFEALARNVAFERFVGTIEGIAVALVVGRDGFGNGA